MDNLKQCIIIYFLKKKKNKQMEDQKLKLI